MNNIVTVVLDNPTFGTAPQIYQYNYGQILRIQGGNFPKAVEVHFSLREKSGDSITRIGVTKDGVTEVPIPELMLENYDYIENYDFWAYIYVEDGTSGTTECKIRIPVKARSKPEATGSSEDSENFGKVIKAVNDAADRAETAEQNAKTSETEAGKYAASASESAATAEKTKEDALREVGEKKQETIEAIQEQEETSVGKLTTHTDDEIQRILNQTAGSKRELEQTITNAGASKEELDHSIETAGTSKTALDKSVELAGTAKTELDTSTQKAGEAKTALDGSAKTAGEMQETLSATVKQAGTLDTSLGEKIETGTQLNEDITASGEKAVQDIQNAGSEQLGKMQAVAEEFTADRGQINVNKEDISILKEEMSKNYLDDAKTKRSLDALWKLNQGISYQFETDTERAYQKDIPSGAKLASVKKIGGRTVVWNQLATNIASKWNFESSNSATVIEEEDHMSSTIKTSNSSHILLERYNNNRFMPVLGHRYYVAINVFLPKKANVHYRTYGYETSRKAIEANIWYTYSDIISPQKGDDSGRPFSIIFSSYNDNAFEAGDKFMFKNIMVIDLTQMFGVGNEPSTPEEFEALFPEDYYPYNEGELMSTPVNKVVEQGRNLLNITEEGLEMAAAGEVKTTRYGYTIPVKKGETYVLSNCQAYQSDLATLIGSSNKITTLTATGDIIFCVCSSTSNKAIAMEYFNARKGIAQIEKSTVATPYSPYHQNIYQIPQAILDLNGYGDGVSDDVYNYVDWENKEYHKKVGKYTIDGSEKVSKENSYWVMTVTNFEKPRPLTINAICTNFKADKAFSGKWGNIIFRSSSNGFVFTDVESKFANANEVKDYFQQNNETIYYELNEEQIIDISDIIDNTFQEPFEVEAGGTLTFQNSNGDGCRLPIPNEEEYIVSLAEVGGGASE